VQISRTIDMSHEESSLLDSKGECID